MTAAVYSGTTGVITIIFGEDLYNTTIVVKGTMLLERDIIPGQITYNHLSEDLKSILGI